MKRCITFLVVILIAFILGPIWGGYVLQIMWGWFISPTFHLPQIGIALAIGISLVIRMLVYQPPAQQKEEKETDIASVLGPVIGWSLLYPLVLLGMGYIVHSFV